MNHLGVDSPQKIFWLIAGAAFGGAAGYMISELIIDRITYGPRDIFVKEEEPDYDKPPSTGFDLGPDDIKKVNYSGQDKQALSELVRPYESESEEDVYVIHESATMDYPVEIIHYYGGDNTYSYESGDLVDDPNGMFVPNAHLHFGELTDQENVVYVRNQPLGTVFEIIKLKGSYKELVLGEVPKEEKKKTKAKPKRSRRAAKPEKDPVEDLTDDPHETDGK